MDNLKFQDGHEIEFRMGTGDDEPYRSTTSPLVAMLSQDIPFTERRPLRVEIDQMREDYSTYSTRYDFDGEIYCRQCGVKGVYVEDTSSDMEDSRPDEFCPAEAVPPDNDAPFDARYEWYQWRQAFGYYEDPAPKLSLSEPDVAPLPAPTLRDIESEIVMRDLEFSMLSFMSHHDKILDRAMEAIAERTNATVDAVRFLIDYRGPCKLDMLHHNPLRFAGYDNALRYLRAKRNAIVFERDATEFDPWAGVIVTGDGLLEIRRGI